MNSNEINDLRTVLKQLREEINQTFDTKVLAEVNAQLQTTAKGFDTIKAATQGVKVTTDTLNKAIAQTASAADDSNNKMTKSYGDMLTQLSKAADTAIQNVAKVVSSVFQGQLQSVKNQTQAATTELDKWHNQALTAAGDNAQKRTAIEKRFVADQQKIHQDQAVKEAQVKRSAAEMDKAISLSKIILNTAESVSKYSGGLPATAPLLAEAITTGAVQAAIVAAQPLPTIPKFATGVIGYKGKGTETSDSNLVAISNMESIIAAQPTKKYGQELEAINNMKFEQLLLNKYLLPALRATNNVTNNTSTETYNDWLLRKDIREGIHINKKAVQKLSEISDSIKGGAFINSRYHT